MKSRQLANVLIKMLGLSVCLYAIPSCVSGLLMAAMASNPAKMDITYTRIISSAIGSGVQALIGIIIIAGSRNLAAMMFKDENE